MDSWAIPVKRAWSLSPRWWISPPMAMANMCIPT